MKQNNMRTRLIAAYKKLQAPVTGCGTFGDVGYNRMMRIAVTCRYTPDKPRLVQEPQPIEPVTAFPLDLDYADALPFVRREKTLWGKIKGAFHG